MKTEAPFHLKAFGWHWTPTKRVMDVLHDLYLHDQVTDIWRTEQFRAIEWLAGHPISPPPEINFVGEEVFYRIAELRRSFIVYREYPTVAELRAAAEALRRALDLVRSANEQLQKVPTSVRRFNYYNTIEAPIEGAEAGLVKRIEMVEGEVAFVGQIHEKLTGFPLGKRGAPPKWLPEIATLLAADIYRTVTGNQPEPFQAPSFENFLARFLEGIPLLNDTDARECARKVWGPNGYKGVRIASHPREE